MTNATRTPPTPPAGVQQTPDSTGSATQLAASVPNVMPRGSYKGMSDPRWPIYWKKREQDREFEWKTQIEFYGRVLDQDQQPISGVEVSLEWTDMSPTGTSSATVTTGTDGTFSITGIRGKNLGIRSLQKNGYIENSKTNRHAFEYAGFWEPTYHEAKPDDHVIFYMRKRGESAPLEFSRGKLLLSLGVPGAISLLEDEGSASPISVTVLENDPKTDNWKAQVSVDGGGIMPALEEFPFNAPKEGYQSSVVLNQQSPLPPGWQDMDEGGCFYIKTVQGYGLLKLRQIIGRKTMHYEILLNREGGTNLEPEDLESAEP